MRWTVHGERTLYDSDWLTLTLLDVELPDGDRFEYHAVRIPREGAGVVVRDAGRGVLLIRRHRVVTDSWSWEIPGGQVDDGETPERAAAREVVEETGWQPGPLRPLGSVHVMPFRVEHRYHVFGADQAEEVAAPADAHEADRIAWLRPAELGEVVGRGEITDACTLAALRLAGL